MPLILVRLRSLFALPLRLFVSHGRGTLVRMDFQFDKSYLIAGTDEDVVAWYTGLAEAGQANFELLEDEIVVMDTETTGLDFHTDKLIEIAACIMRGPEIVDRFQTFVNPGRKIPKEISELTHITNEDVANAPDPSLAVELFAQFADDRNIVAHNASFDKHFIMQEAVPGAITGKWMDSLALARIVLPRIRSHRLADLTHAFGLTSGTHRADADVEATAQLWRVLMAAVHSLQGGLAQQIASLSPHSDWPLRHLFSLAALAQPGEHEWRLHSSRAGRVVHSKEFVLDEEDAPPVCVFPRREQIENAFSKEGTAGRMYPNYEPRPEQLDMALEVTEAFATSTHRSLEAGTGVGKSMAYLLPSAIIAMANNTTIGVATKTNSLMDQLVYNELPRLKGALPGLRYVALKGYDHYPCLRKVQSMMREVDTPRKAEVIEMIATLMVYTSQSSWGDLDALNLYWNGLPRYAIEANSADCLKSRCTFYPGLCYLHGARRMARDAHIVVTNHALLFRDVQLDNGILPPIKRWIVDEAHAAEGEARRQMSHSIAARDLDALMIRLGGKHGALAALRSKAMESDGGVILQGKAAELETQVVAVQSMGANFFSIVKDLQELNESRGVYDRMTLWIGPQVRKAGAWLALEAPGKSLLKKLDELERGLSSLISSLEQFEELAAQQADFNNAACRLEEMRIALELVLRGDDDSFVYSAQLNRNPDKVAEELHASYLEIGKALDADFYPNVESIVFTSATLATGGKTPFQYFEHGAGLDALDAGEHSCRRMASSYDFDKNMKVLLPKGFSEPNAPQYREQLAQLLVDVHVAMGGSVLTLFTNRRDMEQLYKQLKPVLHEQGIELIAQSKGISTKNLKDRFIAEHDLCLFALRSFWEGFDAPGDTLRCVIIPRLPFGRPDDPISRERELREGRAAWGRYSLPEAVMDLKQAAGRLIRNSTDSGYLVLADARLQTKGYGKTFLNALPTTNIRTLPLPQLCEVIRDGR